MSFGERLTSLRKAKSITRKQLADELGIPYTTLRNYEKDDREAGHLLLIKLADYFGVTVDYLLGTSIEKAPAIILEPHSEEHELVTIFRSAQPGDKAALMRFARLVAQAAMKSPDERTDYERGEIAQECVRLQASLQPTDQAVGKK